MIELKKTERSSGIIKDLEAINTEAIPECERNTLEDLMATGAQVLGIHLGGLPAGFFVLREFEQIVYLAYFAVRRDLRSKGIGSQALAQLIRAVPDRRIVVEFESPSGSRSPALASRRKDFYLRNGFYETGWYTFYDDTEFEIACTSAFFDAEAFGRFTEHLSTLVRDHIPRPYRKDS